MTATRTGVVSGEESAEDHLPAGTVAGVLTLRDPCSAVGSYERADRSAGVGWKLERGPTARAARPNERSEGFGNAVITAEVRDGPVTTRYR